MDWPFQDSTNVAVYTSRRIVYGEEWIHCVTHDADDGAWQFHPHGDHTPEGSAFKQVRMGLCCTRPTGVGRDSCESG